MFARDEGAAHHHLRVIGNRFERERRPQRDVVLEDRVIRHAVGPQEHERGVEHREPHVLAAASAFVGAQSRRRAASAARERSRHDGS
jgi:hypothetical protein